MHKLIDFVCDELEDIEQKASKGELSISDAMFSTLTRWPTSRKTFSSPKK